MPGFKKEDLYKFKEAFNIFDARQTGSVQKDDLPALLAILHVSPLKSEIKEQSLKYTSSDGKIKYRDYITILTNLKHRIDDQKQLIEAFQMLQDEPGETISVTKLKELLGSKGEVFSGDEMEKFLNEADSKRNGKVAYKEFVKLLMNN